MGDQLISSVVTVATAIVGLAIIAVLVSRNANTSGVIGAGGSAFAQDIGAAVSPITGGGFGGGFSTMNSGFSGGSAGFMG